MNEAAAEQNLRNFVRDNPLAAHNVGAKWALDEIHRLRRLIVQATTRIDVLKSMVESRK